MPTDAPDLGVPDRTTRPSGPAPGWTLVALATGFVMASLDVTVVNVAGAAISSDVGASLSQLTWIVDGYVLAFCALLMLGGGLAQRGGARRIYLIGMAVFFVASAGCALAPGADALIAARVLQGAGAALFMPSSLSLLVQSFPEQRSRTRMLGLWSAIVATAAGVGPTVGGVLVDVFGWRSIFVINLPIGLIGILLTRRVVPVSPGRPVRLTATGHTLWILGLAAASFALIEGPRLGWSSAPLAVAYVVAMTSALLLVGHERRTADHVMPWDLFRRREFSGANIVGFLFNLALYGGMFMVALYLQNARGSSAFRAGIELLPMTIWFPFGNLVYTRISARFSNGLLLAVFLMVAAIASFAMVSISSTTPYWVLAVALGAANIGAGIISPAMTATLVDSAGVSNANAAGSVLNTNRQIGTLVGVAAMGVVLSATSGVTTGAAWCFGLMGLAYAVAAAIALTMIWSPRSPDSRLAATAAP
ncbi:MFS transporter [Gordonia soli]|uniref:Putative drug resistance transporter n=1 Tax=Gordonia soli NBRC 108243 TaxID=1223545 RepID=M0QQB5_9ACTN|nr:MFS transporter [Gordonia soli]GAC70855.1 putative drug resistance transporter [Gordonia soli NBRC 108243]